MIVDKSFIKCYLLLTNSQNILILKYDKFRGITLQFVDFYSGHPKCVTLYSKQGFQIVSIKNWSAASFFKISLL